MAAEKVKELLLRATAHSTQPVYPTPLPAAMPLPSGSAESTRVPSARRATSISWFNAPTFSLSELALEAVGFVYHHLLDIDMFIDGPEGKPSSGIHLLFAGEKVRQGDENNLPSLHESEHAVDFQVASLEALVRMKLIAWRDKDRTHLRDIIGVGLLDGTWPARLPAPLGARLQQLLDDPNG